MGIARVSVSGPPPGRPGRRSQPLVRPLQVFLHRARAEAEQQGDLGVGLAPCHPQQHLRSATGEPKPHQDLQGGFGLLLPHQQPVQVTIPPDGQKADRQAPASALDNQKRCRNKRVGFGGRDLPPQPGYKGLGQVTGPGRVVLVALPVVVFALSAAPYRLTR